MGMPAEDELRELEQFYIHDDGVRRLVEAARELLAENERLHKLISAASDQHERDTNTLERLDEAGDKLLGDMPAGVATVFGDGIAALLDATGESPHSGGGDEHAGD